MALGDGSRDLPRCIRCQIRRSEFMHWSRVMTAEFWLPSTPESPSSGTVRVSRIQFLPDYSAGHTGCCGIAMMACGSEPWSTEACCTYTMEEWISLRMLRACRREAL